MSTATRTTPLDSVRSEEADSAPTSQSIAQGSGSDADRSKHFSDLELDRRRHYSDLEAIQPDHSTLEVAASHGRVESLSHSNLQAYHPGVPDIAQSSGPYPYHPGVNKDSEGPILDEKNAGQRTTTANEVGSRRICGLRRRIFWIVFALVILVVVGAAVGGGVGGTINKSSSNTDNSVPSNASPPESGGTSGSNSTTDQDPNNGIRTNTNLATVAWQVSDSRYQYRVYYQGEDNALKESAYDSASGSWAVSTLVDGSAVAPNTTIAAAASKSATTSDGNTPVYVYYFDVSLDIHLFVTGSGGGASASGPQLIPYTEQTALPELAAYYFDCDLCSRNIILAGAALGRVVWMNMTTTNGWDSTIYDMNMEAMDGSSLAFQPYSITGYADQLNLYYQRSDGQLLLASWFSDQYQSDSALNLASNNGWQMNGDNSAVTSMPANASFAVTYLGHSNGSPAYVEAISTAPNTSELQVSHWTSNAWASTSVPDVFTGLSENTAIAAHWYQRAYAVRDGALVQFSIHDDGVTWTVQSTVPTL